MTSNPQKYYHPYDSGDDTKYKSGNTSDYSSDSDSDSDTDSAAQGLNDPRYAIIKASGPSFNTVNEQLMYQTGKALGSSYQPESKDDLKNSVLYLDPKKKAQTTLFSMKSANRDKKTYPSPANFTIRLPRPFKNVSLIQLVQISFQYFADAILDISGIQQSSLIPLLGSNITSNAMCYINKSTILNSFGLTEVGRMDPNDPTQDLTLLVKVRPDRYTLNTIVGELNLQMNNTPPFNIISYADFQAKLIATGSMESLFNEPGQYYYNKLTKTFINGPLKSDIYGTYYPSEYIVPSIYPTPQQIFTAYYYPVLKDVMMTIDYWKMLNLNGDSFETAFNRIVNHFEGINSTYYYNLILLNYTFLVKWRRLNTFEYYPINQYSWNYDGNINIVSETHTALNLSIINDIEINNANNLSIAITSYGLTLGEYTLLQAAFNQGQSIFLDLESFMNSYLAKIRVPWSLYPGSNLANSNYVIYTDYSTANPNYFSNTSDVAVAIATGQLTSNAYPNPTPPYPYTNGFGFNTMSNIEWQVRNTGTLIDPVYKAAITDISNSAVFNGILGNSYIPGYSGVDISWNNFSNFYYEWYVPYNTSNLSNSTVLSNIQGLQKNLTSNYVNTKYTGIIPPSILNNNSFIIDGSVSNVIYKVKDVIFSYSSPFIDISCVPSPIQSEIVKSVLTNWYGDLPANYFSNTLPNKIGFNPKFGNYTSFITTSNLVANSLSQNVYLQLNIEKSMNNMSVATTEDLTVTNDPGGENKVVLGKILTEGSGIGDITQTIIQSPATFSPPVGKLDHLHFTLLLDDLVPIQSVMPYGYTFCDWNATIQIDEEVATLEAKDLSTVPTVQWEPDKRPF
jgi:hypothetical protein